MASLKQELLDTQQMRAKDAEKHRREQARLEERQGASTQFAEVSERGVIWDVEVCLQYKQEGVAFWPVVQCLVLCECVGRTDLTELYVFSCKPSNLHLNELPAVMIFLSWQYRQGDVHGNWTTVGGMHDGKVPHCKSNSLHTVPSSTAGWLAEQGHGKRVNGTSAISEEDHEGKIASTSSEIQFLNKERDKNFAVDHKRGKGKHKTKEATATSHLLAFNCSRRPKQATPSENYSTAVSLGNTNDTDMFLLVSV